jgi:GT2 family glycosyltransferase
MSQPLISVIVLNWNGRHFLKSCLDSLLVQTHGHREIIVVDNGSTDGSVEFLKACYGSQIVLIKNGRNEGFAKGVNIGVNASRGQYIALLNNDAVADKRWLEELMKGVSQGETVGMCASKILLLSDRQVIDKVGHLLYPDGLNAGRGLGERDRGQYDRMEEVLFPDGSAALYRKAMLDEIGLFDEQFFAYGDDADLGLRGRLFKWTCMYVPTAVVYHVHSGTLGRLSPLKALLVERNRFWLALKLLPLPLLFLSPFFTVARFFWHAYGAFAGQGTAGRFAAQHSKSRLLLILIRAYLSGLTGVPAIIKKRREIRRRKRMTDEEFLMLLHRFRISAKELALRDR